jgi:hypothetical protein
LGFSSKERNAIEVRKKTNCGFSCKGRNVVVVSHPKKEMFS